MAHGRDVIVSVPQSEANVDVDKSNLTVIAGGGLLFALIDAAVEKSRASDAEDTVKPIREALIDYDFERNALDAVKQATAKVNWLAVNGTVFTKEATNDNFAKLMDDSAASQIMYNNFDYVFSSDFKTLRVGLRTTILPRTSPSTPDQKATERLADKNAVYYNKWVYAVTLPSPGNDKRANAQLWAENQGALARDALNKGIDRVTQDLISDLENSPDQLAKTPSKEELMTESVVR
ncbi:hypothetical protein EVC45_36320 [Paraburkholderia sp. UYCP14C]|uniref:hypothetical protein n=1 Tax=Paraburkholderia sp. UYCP14C TaxID=2511130 RepID=UPI0010206C97|nr:hypothetical protein [Paraburkholderia sp. UYCP14C]RZF24877.1 hypothetical protein EVC45_36320 [Paraburkholderia sp. UYCP14C]